MGRDVRLSYIDRLSSGLADVRISRSPLRKDVVICLNKADEDIYRDVVTSQEFYRVNKQAIVQKNPSMYYVQETYGILLEPEDQLPWVVIVTLTDLPRPLKLNDRIVVSGVVYVVSKVKPTNRELGSIIECLVYPERDTTLVNDPLAIYKVRFREGASEVPVDDVRGKSAIMDVIYGGCPRYMSFDGSDWRMFSPRSRVLVPEQATQLFVKDEESKTAVTSLGSDSTESETKESSKVKYL